MAMLGKEVRMSRLVNPKSNKMMAITVDHAISRGIAPMQVFTIFRIQSIKSFLVNRML